MPDKVVSVQFDTSAVGLFVEGLGSIIKKPETIVIVFTMLFVDFLIQLEHLLLYVIMLVKSKNRLWYE